MLFLLDFLQFVVPGLLNGVEIPVDEVIDSLLADARARRHGAVIAPSLVAEL